MKLRALIAAGLMIASVGASAQQTVTIPSRFNPAMNGEVMDDWVKGIRWKRCVEGMAWDASSKSCTGSPDLFTYDEAKALAANTPGWRLPDPGEFRSLVDCGGGEVRSIITKNRWAYMPYSCSRVTNAPTINKGLFPNAPAGGHWSMAQMTMAGHEAPAWALDFSDGVMAPTAPFYEYHVRLMNRDAAKVRDDYLADQNEQKLYDNANDIDGMELYLSVLPKGKRASEVRKRLDDRLFAQATDEAGSMAYLERFPNGLHAKAVGIKLDNQLAAKANSISGMIHYLKLLPNGQQARAIRARLESTLFDRATTERGMTQYLAHFPSGARSDEVKSALKNYRLDGARNELAKFGYVPVEQGAAAYQKTSGLTWARCSFGQRWNALKQVCTGKATIFAEKDLASLQIPEGWRLPTESELMLIRDCTSTDTSVNYGESCYSKDLMINRTVFPGTPPWKVTGAFYNNVPYFTVNRESVGFLRLDKPGKSKSGGFVRLVKGEVRNVEKLCSGIEHYFYEAKATHNPYRYQKPLTSRIEGVPFDSFEFRWRTAARKLAIGRDGRGGAPAGAEDNLIGRCIMSFHQDSGKGEGV